MSHETPARSAAERADEPAVDPAQASAQAPAVEPAHDPTADTGDAADEDVLDGDGPHRGRLYRRLHANPVLGLVTRIVVTVLGTLVILAGIVMLFTPGQGILAVILGLWILRFEYAWADRWLRHARERARLAKERAQQMDPRVRRRRVLLMAAATVVVVGAVVWYVVVYGWPGLAVDSWDWLQSLAGWVPELPGM